MTAKDIGAQSHLGLVHSCCKRFANRGIEYEELFAAGSLGLSKALNRFDSGMGCKFSTYAFPVIMGEIKKLFRDGGSMRVSRSIKELSLKITRLNNESVMKNGRELTLSQLSKALGVSGEKVAEAIESARPVASLAELTDDENGREREIPSPDIQYEISERLSLRQALGKLDDSDRELIVLRYYKGLTQVQTASVLGTTQVTVSRREKKLLQILREQLV